MADPRDSGERVDDRAPDRRRPRPDGGSETDRPGADETADQPTEGADETADRLERTDGEDDSPPEEDLTEAQLRRRVEQEYDFDDFGPRDMAEMTREEWEAAFDADSWITGAELLERVEAELKSRIAERDVFATLEFARIDGERSLVAYSDRDYAIVFPDGSVEGRGTVVRDVKPTVALCSMDDYEVDGPPANWALPAPEEVPERGSELGNWMLQLLAGTQLLVGLGALVAWPVLGARDNLVLLAAGLGFGVIGILLFMMVANARLSSRFRVEEYRNRLRSAGVASGERPEFLPIEDDAFETTVDAGSSGE